MKSLFLAVLLAIMQTAPPIPRQAANKPAPGGQNKQTPAPSPPVPNAITEKDQNSSPTPSKANAQESIIVRELPPVAVTTTPDWWNRAYVIFTGLLVVIGGFGVCAALRTLRTMERQADIMRGQLTVPYRAYLGLIEPEKPITDLIHNINSAKFPIENTGHVRAKITKIDAEVIIQDRGGKELFRRSKVEEIKSDEGEVPPEKTSSYAVTVLWPSNIPAAEQTAISVVITYRTGFKGIKPGVFSFVRVFRTSLQDWAKGYWGADIDLASAQDDKKQPN